MSRSHRKNEPVFYVYVLLDPRKPGPFFYGHWKFSHEPFYVGKGKDDRAWQHLRVELIPKVSSSAMTHKMCKIRKILRETKLLPIVEVKRKALVELDAYAIERKLIRIIGRSDSGCGPLVNQTDGGDGGKGQAFSVSTRTKIRRNSKKMHRNFSEEERIARGNKISASKKKAWEELPIAERKRRGILASTTLVGLSEAALKCRSQKIARGQSRYQATLTPEQRLAYSKKMSEVVRQTWLKRKAAG